MYKGKVVACNLDYIMPLQQTKEKDIWGNYKYDYKFDYKKKFDVNDTYILIFGPTQNRNLEYFLKKFKGNILFKSDKCYNSQHPGSPRNTVVVFELYSDTAPFGSKVNEQAAL